MSSFHNSVGKYSVDIIKINGRLQYLVSLSEKGTLLNMSFLCDYASQIVQSQNILKRTQL